MPSAASGARFCGIPCWECSLEFTCSSSYAQSTGKVQQQQQQHRSTEADLFFPDEHLAALQVLIAAAVLQLEAGRQDEASNGLPHVQKQSSTPEEHHNWKPVVEGCSKQGHIFQGSSHLLAEHHCLQACPTQPEYLTLACRAMVTGFGHGRPTALTH